MNGTEKQITWANEIIDRCDNIISAAKANFPADATAEQLAIVNATIDKIVAWYKGIKNAGNVIDALKNVKSEADLITSYRAYVELKYLTYRISEK